MGPWCSPSQDDSKQSNCTPPIHSLSIGDKQAMCAPTPCDTLEIVDLPYGGRAGLG